MVTVLKCTPSVRHEIQGQVMNSETGDKKPVTVHLIIAFLERATENKCTVTEFVTEFP